MRITRVLWYSTLLLVALAASPQQRASQPPKEPTPLSRTRVVLLGTGTPVPDPDRSGPASAIVVDDSAYLVDFAPVLSVAPRPLFSTGTLRRLSPPT